MSSSFRSFGSKTVKDAEDRPLGRVVGSEVNPSTRETTALLVERIEGTSQGEESTFWVPVSSVTSIRREAIQLATSMAEIVGQEAASTPPEPEDPLANPD